MPAEGSDLVMSARAELITAEDPYFRGIDADASLPHWMTVRPLASTSPGGPHIVDLADAAGSSTPSCGVTPTRRSSSPKPSGPDVCATGTSAAQLASVPFSVTRSSTEPQTEDPPSTTVLGEPETVEEAVALIAANLPEGCGPAIDGSANDL
ncbi:DUF6193 family natural product biosynthesis protein [Streptomyces anulatus]